MPQNAKRGNLHAVVCFSEFNIMAAIVSLLSHILKKDLTFLLKKIFMNYIFKALK